MDRSRRTFLATGGVITAGTLLGFNPALSWQKTGDIRLGVIGSGSRGQELERMIKQIPGIKTTACCDVIPFRLEEGLQYAEPKAKGYTDYRKLLDDKDIDAVIISTPFGLHSKMAIDALDAGKHVYCEKTMSRGIQETHEVVKKARSSNNIFQTGHQYHFSRLYLAVVDFIRKGKIGDVAAIRCQWNRNGSWRRAVPDPKWERLINWRMYREFSGGLAAELSSHQIDFSNWIMEAHPVKATGFGGVDFYKDGRETFDNIHLLYEYPNGVKASFTCLTTNKHDNYQIKVMGSKGTIILDFDKAEFFSEERQELAEDVDGVTGATEALLHSGEPIEVEHMDPTLQALTDFRDSIAAGKAPISDVMTGAVTSICVQMALDAMLNERVEYWKESYNL